MTLGDRPVDHGGDREVQGQGHGEQHRVIEALNLVQAEGEVVGLTDQGAFEGGQQDAAEQEDRYNQEHSERKPLLFPPSAAFDVVDPAERRIHRTPEGSPDPE